MPRRTARNRRTLRNVGLGLLFAALAGCPGEGETADCTCIDQRDGKQTTTPNLTREQCAARETEQGEKVRACQTPLGEVNLGRPELWNPFHATAPNGW